jgi:DnaJ family protein C protein 27
VRSVEISGVEVKVNFWDLSGHPEFFDVRNEFYKDAPGAILVYDVGSRRSFENLDTWLKVRPLCPGFPVVHGPAAAHCWRAGSRQVWSQGPQSGRVRQQGQSVTASFAEPSHAVLNGAAACPAQTDAKKRVVSQKDGQAWAAARGYRYFDTSAASGDRVEESFMELFSQVLTA